MVFRRTISASIGHFLTHPKHIRNRRIQLRSRLLLKTSAVGSFDLQVYGHQFRMCVTSDIYHLLTPFLCVSSVIYN